MVGMSLFDLMTMNYPLLIPDWLENYVNAVAESTQTPPDMASMAVLSTLSIAAAKKVNINPSGDWFEPLNTYILTLMGPANRKSSVFREITKPVFSYEMLRRDQLEIAIKQRESDRKAKAKRIDYLEGVYGKEGDENVHSEIRSLHEELKILPEMHLPTLVTDDSTPETLVTLLKQNNERLGVLSAEAGIFGMIEGRYSGQIKLEVYLKGHSGDQIRVDRRGRSESIEAPALTIGVVGQNNVKERLPAAFQGRGLMARFLYALPNDFRGYRKSRPKPIPKEIRKEYQKDLISLFEVLEDQELTLSISEEADSLFIDFQERIEHKLRDHGDLADILEWGGKIVGNMAPLLGLIHLANHIKHPPTIPNEIDAITTKKCLMLEDYLIEHPKAAFGFMKANQNTEEAIYVLKVIQKKNEKGLDKYNANLPIPFRGIQQNVKYRMNSRKLHSVIQELEDRGYVRKFDKQESGNKPKQYLILNPFC
ncbi:YfjI family protein [Metabacillus sp. RGM 3146]|uniref:YfjI family protein n=1 Tax=Metabacillus sp. RGM 3146 TaxID=3401092 RepID=UPI003B9DA467